MRRKPRQREDGTELNPTGAPKAPPPDRTLVFGQRLAIYVIIMIVGVAASLLLHENFGLDYDRSVCLAIGPLFLLAATGRPWWLYSTIREVYWFALITSEVGMHAVLAVLGVLLVLFGAGVFVSN